jgi:acetyltransferase EpsM
MAGDGAHLGLGAVLLPGVAIGPWATLGAGAVLIDSLPGAVTAVGVPARELPNRTPALGGRR